MNSQKRLALALVLSTIILLIGVALLAMYLRTPPLEPSLSQHAEQSLEQARRASGWERNMRPEAALPSEFSPVPESPVADFDVATRSLSSLPAQQPRSPQQASPDWVSGSFEEEIWVIAKASPAEDFTGYGDPITTLDEDDLDPGSGSLVVSIPSVAESSGTKRLPLPLQHTAVDAAVDGHIGTVQVKQQFANPFDTKIEAVYVFPLPEKAAITEFLMVIGERTIRGVLREKSEAEAIYREARAQGYQASLLVQRRPNIFEQKVANIEPGNAIDVDITYFHTLAYKDGWYSFVFPTVVGPRFSPPGHPDSVPALPRGGNSAMPGATGVEYLAPAERSGHDLGITIRIDAGMAIEELKSTHEIVVERDGPASAIIQLANRTTIPNRDFVLDFRVAGELVKSNLMTYKDPETGEGFFSLMLIPPIDTEVVARRPMEMVFVIDCSGSMAGQPLAQAKEAIATVLARLNPNDTFQIVRFSDDAALFGRKPVRATGQNLAAARRYLAALDSQGGTWMIEGIKAALDFPHNPSHFRFVTFLTDGYIDNETEILAEVHRRLDTARIFSFGVGTAVNRYLLERMAKVGRGAVAYLGLNDSAEDVMGAFFERVSHAALTDIEIDWGGMTVSDIYPTRLPDLFVGRPLVVAGRFQGEPRSVTLSGTVDGSRRSFVLDAAEQVVDRQSIAKVWARANIADLYSRQVTVGDPQGELHDVITRIALQHQLVSSYTSFVAVDSYMPTEGLFGVTVHQAVPVPEGVRYETTVASDGNTPLTIDQ